jgi:hypothetical protein
MRNLRIWCDEYGVQSPQTFGKSAQIYGRPARRITGRMAAVQAT